jgi:hypothetical protein
MSALHFIKYVFNDSGNIFTCYKTLKKIKVKKPI